MLGTWILHLRVKYDILVRSTNYMFKIILEECFIMKLLRITEEFIENTVETFFKRIYTFMYNKGKSRLRNQFHIPLHWESGTSTSFDSVAEDLLCCWCESLQCFTPCHVLSHVMWFYFRGLIQNINALTFLIASFTLSLESVFTFQDWGPSALGHFWSFVF